MLDLSHLGSVDLYQLHRFDNSKLREAQGCGTSWIHPSKPACEFVGLDLAHRRFAHSDKLAHVDFALVRNLCVVEK